MWLFKRFSNLLSRLIALNSFVILLVILVAGISVKDYACFLVNSEQVTGQALVDTLNGFLWKVGIVVFIIVGLFHYFTVRKMMRPIKSLSAAAKLVREGSIPSNIDVRTSGEMKELIESFNSMTETLYAVQEQREEMLRDIAHELRTPLTNINGYLEALQNEVIEGDSELFGSLLEESQRITRIVEMITELNSWDDGNFFSDKEFHPVMVNEVLAKVVTTFQLKLENNFKNIDIHIEQAELLGNQDGLKQAITNILQNIIDYNTEETLTVNGSVENETYTIVFSHTGQFIDPEKKELIFERFYRLEQSRSTETGGAGLGLAITKSIIASHGGKVGIKTNGTCHTFWIKLPLN
ncbi:HAMP domain-containing histidine kinase [Siminovitchia acidinfaciens]|uniref:histidine kinase n=1 Tax=Siminovitchia acidinfaciens TaxID=2321395 RepID=A0A429Y6W1_9BACI|nr:HAMP domain-containing sensor histidine kinase [Siminovitchia acidinfaciens]RST77122.1 HAMP domain-containing histidine kinase [Siminovitchia acidinfaciens]